MSIIDAAKQQLTAAVFTAKDKVICSTRALGKLDLRLNTELLVPCDRPQTF